MNTYKTLFPPPPAAEGPPEVAADQICYDVVSSTPCERLVSAAQAFQDAIEDAVASDELHPFVREAVALAALTAAYPPSYDDEDLDEDEMDLSLTTTADTWSMFFNKDTLSVAFKLPYTQETGEGALKVNLDEHLGSWYFDDTFYPYSPTGLVFPVEHFLSKHLFLSPGEALYKAEQWLAAQDELR